MNDLIKYTNTNDIMDDVCNIIESAQRVAIQSANISLVLRNWLLGKRISEEELKGEDRAEYGLEVVKRLSDSLTEKYGKGFSKRTIYKFLQFYKTFPKIVPTVSAQSVENGIVPTLSAQLLSWSHYERLLQVEDKDAREWYAKEASEQMWSYATLNRNISTQYYERLLLSQDKDPVKQEMKTLTKGFDNDKLEFVKNPFVAEFLGMSPTKAFVESELETAILTNLEKFLLELGKGFSFVERQKLIRTEAKDYFIDLVFYNFKLKCFVLIDLKVGQITHQDVGQMEMYVNMYDQNVREDGDNPTLGIVLCSETDADIAKYMLNDSKNVFMSKYLLCLPSKEQLKAEIERQKALFALQQNS